MRPRAPNAARAAIAVLLAMLVACAPMRTRDGVAGDTGSRRAALEAFAAWRFDGRVAVSDGREGGSARIQWRQDGEYYTVDVRAPVSGTPWRLSGDGAQCELSGTRANPVRGVDPAELLARETGWHLPLPQVRDWVRGLAHDRDHASVVLDPDGQPLRIDEAGWTVEYLDWHAASPDLPAMPRRLRARNPPHEVRLAIASWDLGHG
jgi:outer membrane lipoprotein LolB